MPTESLKGLIDGFSSRRQKLSKALDESIVLQRAKFQARCNYGREKVLSAHKSNLHLHNMKVKIDKEYLM